MIIKWGNKKSQEMNWILTLIEKWLQDNNQLKIFML